MNKRIQTIANMIQKGEVVADIGTDHALLPICLVEQRISNKVYACDIAEGPLLRAKKNIAEKGMIDKIKTLLSDGLTNVPNDVTTFVITGIGYHTAVHILEEGLPRISPNQDIVLGVQSEIKEMRQWISNHHFTIEDEAFITEGNHDYIFIRFNTTYHDAYAPVEILCGPILVDKKDPAYMDYCHKQVEKLNQIIKVTNQLSEKQKKIAERNLWLFISLR